MAAPSDGRGSSNVMTRIIGSVPESDQETDREGRIRRQLLRKLCTLTDYRPACVPIRVQLPPCISIT